MSCDGRLEIIKTLYSRLLEVYGPQGWWPIKDIGYHKGNYAIPETAEQRFEIVVGAILTQNTSWNNVKAVIERLYVYKDGVIDPKKIMRLPTDELAEIIRSSGYYNQKALKLKEISGFLFSKSFSFLDDGFTPERKSLLNIWGVGPETADSILLYAFKEPVFVVDAYTKRLLSRLGLISKDKKGNAGYDYIQKLFMDNLPCKTEIYNEYHALIVRHAKEHCRKRPVCNGCPIIKYCMYPGT